MVFFSFQALIVVAVSLTCYFFASRCGNLNLFFFIYFFRVNVRCSNLPFFRYRRFMVSSRDSLIERPVDLLQELRGGGGGHEEEEEGKKKQ